MAGSRVLFYFQVTLLPGYFDKRSRGQYCVFSQAIYFVTYYVEDGAILSYCIVSSTELFASA